jgi:hypothetical protein
MLLAKDTEVTMMPRRAQSLECEVNRLVMLLSVATWVNTKNVNPDEIARLQKLLLEAPAKNLPQA